MKRTAKTYRFNDETIKKLQELEKIEAERKERGLLSHNATQIVEKAIGMYFDAVVENNEKELSLEDLYKTLLLNQEGIITLLKLVNSSSVVNSPKTKEDIEKIVNLKTSVFEPFIEKKVAKKLKGKK